MCNNPLTTFLDEKEICWCGWWAHLFLSNFTSVIHFLHFLLTAFHKNRMYVRSDAAGQSNTVIYEQWGAFAIVACRLCQREQDMSPCFWHGCKHLHIKHLWADVLNGSSREETIFHAERNDMCCLRVYVSDITRKAQNFHTMYFLKWSVHSILAVFASFQFAH